MTWAESPAWLLELQGRFGQMLRTPLERGRGSLRANTDAYDAELLREARPSRDLPSSERLAIYNRQYWFRLLTLLQRAFPLCARLLGYWQFNRFAADFLARHPPRGWDLDDVALGFTDFLQGALPPDWVELGPGRGRVAALALLQAARIDAAYHAVFRAPPVSRYEPTLADAERLLLGQLRFSPAVAVLTESWPLCELRRRVVAGADETPVVLEPRLAQPRFWLLGRDELKLGLVPLEATEARLLELLQRHPVGIALGRLEAGATAEERTELPAKAQAWLAQSVRLGVWGGIVVPEAPEPE